MKIFMNKKTIKNLIIIVSIITILSGLVSMPVQAKTDTEDGGDILHPIEDFILFLSDKVMEWLQHTFVSVDDIEVEEGVYNFQYSPAIIFSGTVPAFDINFIDPASSKSSSSGGGNIVTYIEQNEGTYRETQSIDTDEYEQKLEEINSRGYDGVLTGREYMFSNDYRSTIQYDLYYYIDDKSTEESSDDVLVVITLGEYGTKVGNSIVRRSYVYAKHEESISNTDISGTIRTYESTAQKLQSTIATWYNVLRRIALVGLLSVIVYIGIRMVMSSAAGEKAKYKEMLKDWIVAICILFTLHYIMSLTITITNEISDIFQTGESDTLLNTLRQEIFSEKDRGIILAKTIMYVVLVILTVTFTIQYLKRVVYMAFYTLIAPLITLTYPLDKIKDGQAQAFTIWIREYVYTALMQIIHLVIYTVLVGSALDLVSNYPLYAIVALLFIKKADGIIKKMFGFDKSETVGTLGAAATGALVVNALNQIARKRWSKKR